MQDMKEIGAECYIVKNINNKLIRFSYYMNKLNYC